MLERNRNKNNNKNNNKTCTKFYLKWCYSVVIVWFIYQSTAGKFFFCLFKITGKYLDPSCKLYETDDENIGQKLGCTGARAAENITF